MTHTKSKAVATWLALLLGVFGLHRLYLYGLRDKLAWLLPTYPDEPLPIEEAQKLKGLNLAGQIPGLAALDRLDSDAERDLAKALQRYPEVLLKAAEAYEPHQLSNYLKELASEFHGWYNSTKVLVDDEPLRQARLTLSLGVRQVIANGLGLLGVAAPERM